MKLIRQLLFVLLLLFVFIGGFLASRSVLSRMFLQVMIDGDSYAIGSCTVEDFLANGWTAADADTYVPARSVWSGALLKDDRMIQIVTAETAQSTPLRSCTVASVTLTRLSHVSVQFSRSAEKALEHMMDNGFSLSPSSTIRKTLTMVHKIGNAHLVYVTCNGEPISTYLGNRERTICFADEVPDSEYSSIEDYLSSLTA